jgi:hypothetical protein
MIMPVALGNAFAPSRSNVLQDVKALQIRPCQRAARRRRAILLARRPERTHDRGTDDHVTLLLGPYRAPRLRPGDRATCLLRDCTVIIRSLTDAPIPGPDAGRSARGARGARRRLGPLA